MKVYEVDKKEFYKGYTLKYLLFFRRHLNKIEKELNVNNLESALVLTMEHPYVNYPEFNFYRINILIRLGHIDLALDVASKEEFANFEPIQIQKRGLEEEIRIRNEQEEARLKNDIIKTSEQNVSRPEDSIRRKNLMTKLYVGVLTIDDIDNSKLPYFDKVLFTICYYDKYNRAAGLKYIKSIKDTIKSDKERKIINNLRNRLGMKHDSFFDIAFYKKYLCGVDFAYASRLESEIKEQERKRTQETITRQEPLIQREVAQDAIVSEEPVVLEHRTSEEVLVTETNLEEKLESFDVYEQKEEIVPDIQPSEPEEIKVVKAKKNKKTKVQKPDNLIVRIKDVFASEVDAIGSILYVETNNLGTTSAMKAFDIFESIVEQDVNNISSLEKFERLVIKFSRDKRLGVTYNEERFNKYLKKEQK